MMITNPFIVAFILVPSSCSKWHVLHNICTYVIHVVNTFIEGLLFFPLHFRGQPIDTIKSEKGNRIISCILPPSVLPSSFLLVQPRCVESTYISYSYVPANIRGMVNWFSKATIVGGYISLNPDHLLVR